MRGKAYRIHVDAKKKKRLIKIISYRNRPLVGDIKYKWDKDLEDVGMPIGVYVKRPKHSKMQKYLKTQSKRTVRRSKKFPDGNCYKKCIEYTWEFW